MQTFLPYASFVESARCLDYKRLGKQRVEAKQILMALGVEVGGDGNAKGSGWRHHPAVRMWRWYETALCEYAIAICTEWRLRGYRDSLLNQFVDTWLRLGSDGKPPLYPGWLGEERFHASHRGNLLRKDERFYGKYGWMESPDLEYFWPV